MDAGEIFLAMFVKRNESPDHNIVGLTVRIVRYSHLTSLHKLSRQEELAKFYASVNGISEHSGEHRGNTEAKNGRFKKK
jgi:hypothetical protein